MPKTRLARFWQKAIRALIRLGLSFILWTAPRFPYRWVLNVGKSCGSLAFWMLWRERRRAIQNITLSLGGVYPPLQLREIVKGSFRNLGQCLLEFLALNRLIVDQINPMIRIEGEEYLKEAVSRGRGVILLTAHMGNWEIGGVAIAKRYGPLGVVAAPMYDPWVDATVIGIRKRWNIQTVLRADPRAPRQILSLLRQGGILGIFIDQNTRVEGLEVPFFGREAYTPSGPATLALRTGAAVIMGFMVRQSDRRHVFVIKKPIELSRTGNKEEDVRINTALFTSVVEEAVRENPDQWIWMHDRWKTPRAKQ